MEKTEGGSNNTTLISDNIFSELITRKNVYSIIESGNRKYLIIIFPINTNSKTTGYAAGILNIDDRYLFENDFEMPDEKEIMLLSEDNGPIFFNPTGLKVPDDIIPLREGSAFNYNIVINKKKYIGFSKNLDIINWNLTLLEDRNYAFSRIDMMIFLLLFIIAVGFILTVISFIIGMNLIIKPINNFVKDTGKIANGNRDIQIKKHRLKEFYALSRNFKKMLFQIGKRETELRKSELKYKKLVEDNMDLIFKISNQFKFTFISHSLEYMLGCTKGAFLGNTERYIELKNRMNIRARIITRNVFRNKKNPDPFLVTAINENGEKLVLEIQETPIIHNGKVTEIQGIARDITTRYHFEQEVIYLKNYLYNIIESLPSAIITTDKNGYIQMFNTSALKMLEKTSSEIFNKQLWKISSRFENYKNFYDEASDKNKVVEFSEKFNNDKNETRYYNAAFFPLKRPGIKGMVLRIDDVTLLQNAEQQLKQSQKLEIVGTMASGLAHDFNNIIGSILGTVTLLIYKTRDSATITFEDLREELDIITEALNKASGIIQQLMSLSKNQTPVMERIDLIKEIDQVISLCRTSFPGNIELIWNRPDHEACINASQVQVSQLLLNLLVNAKDSIKGKGKGFIKLTLKKYAPDVFLNDSNHEEKNDNYWLLTISDNGSGIPEDIKQSVFDPFFTTKGNSKGTGLGLTVVNNIVKQHAGFISFDSTVGSGTTFKIYLPVNNQCIAEIDNDHTPIVQPEKKNLILVVDDEKNIRIMTRKILIEIGFEVISVDNAVDAIAVYNSRHGDIDAVILDLIIPEKSGKEIFEEMKNINKDVKVLLISGAKKDTRIKELLEIGVKSFLPKPFSFNDLSSAIKKILD